MRSVFRVADQITPRFLIPMRGNERFATAICRVNAPAFLIPMRGNESWLVHLTQRTL